MILDALIWCRKNIDISNHLKAAACLVDTISRIALFLREDFAQEYLPQVLLLMKQINHAHFEFG